ncbi:MAG: GHMP kinase [Pleurocapsa sp. SU_5_0]|nr:GHMP kinase [Pleurocapsa sp. SU_5_0]NJR45342.1 GHMP kinase [Hyellaceae cyanobacterium CSU_1_1]
MDVFVSGRLCLFGEHSDWAGEYRQVNPHIEPGSAVVVGTNQGIYAHVNQSPLLVLQTLHSAQILELAMDKELLLAMAQTDSFYSYVAGVAYQALIRYQVGGLAINNYGMDLPLQKGLSSSAAICVLVARAFNLVYDLGLSIAEEMELAYWGERTTPSHCGRLDQACAYGRQPILMTFDGDRYTTHPLTVGQNLHLIIVDLAGAKNTQKILAQLNHCYPQADNPIAVQVQKYLGEINQALVKQAVTALQQGNAESIGALMNQAQAEFDRYVAPACPEQLNAPILHQLLNHSSLQPYIYGGKGVGSQGDGTAQLIALDRNSQSKAIALITRNFPQMQCYRLDIPKQIN